MAKKKSRPMFKSVTMILGAMGSTAKVISTVTTMIAGASTKTGLSAKGGIQSSLVKILIMSATTWRRPKGPTRLGP